MGSKSGFHRTGQDFTVAMMIQTLASRRIPLWTTLTAQTPVDQFTRTPAISTDARAITNGRAALEEG
jgi:hypothetical protein